MPETRLNLPFTGIPSFMRAPIVNDLDELDADIAVLGVPSDEGSPWYPGARMAPRQIREMSVRYAEYGPTQRHGGYYDLDEDRRYLVHETRNNRIVDCGDVDIVYTNPEQTMANVTRSVRSILDAGALPVVYGGDHAISYGVVRAYEQPVILVHFDAHLDFRPFVHGAQYGNGSPVRKMSSLKQVGQMVQVGMRSMRMSQDDLADARRHGNDVITMKQYRRHGLERLLDRIPGGAAVYVSMDIDVLDMPLVPGCASAEPDGFGYEEMKQTLFGIARHADVVGFDIVEINPMIDVRSNNTSLLGAQLGVEFMARVADSEPYLRRNGRLLATEPSHTG
ncbi:arginase family protein [Streptomyces sp. NPDC001698]|uniref:arginase family protein n=1 Tax=unclassified Streptomyces TaxID=2593676 RepID=UPI0036C32666